MLMDVYFEKMKETLAVIERTQREQIISAARMVAIPWRTAACGRSWIPGTC